MTAAHGAGTPSAHEAPSPCGVLVVGGGPTGLFLACLLATGGVDVQVLERRTVPRDQSRAIGLHPPALEALAAVGLDAAAVAAGTRIRRGRARSRGRELGTLRFARAWPQRPYVLSLPQSRTEALLERRLAELAPGALHRGWEVTGLQEEAQGVAITAQRAEGTPATGPAPPRRAAVVVGADGSRSGVRRLLGIPTTGGEGPDTYLMGDLADPGAPGERSADREAIIHLEPDGVVESFPLPDHRRRWVVHTGTTPPVQPTARTLTDLVRARTGVSLEAATCSMLSVFTVRRRTARTMLSGRCLLVGDAVHEISPIGGQGITLGWLDALELAPLLQSAAEGESRGPLNEDPAWQRAERRIRRRARRAGHLAQANTVLGRPLPPTVAALREVAVGIALRSPLREVMAWAYSMGWTRARRASLTRGPGADRAAFTLRHGGGTAAPES
ncbi:NAD(P)/FAD-dependent oxidoreductase [Brachybacterium sp. YJGR34]|uniref:FAD-dependent oxidoreductase n=1 Tax=Brachybacterium sp. YJGR34 TaxID=2059911 RepID=UPI000E0ADFED|nr:NAD(P)/FAD-dependent oxidoreductase [Brachybacterium sp. YJGR34]